MAVACVLLQLCLRLIPITSCSIVRGTQACHCFSFPFEWSVSHYMASFLVTYRVFFLTTLSGVSMATLSSAVPCHGTFPFHPLPSPCQSFHPRAQPRVPSASLYSDTLCLWIGGLSHFMSKVLTDWPGCSLPFGVCSCSVSWLVYIPFIPSCCVFS